MAYIVQRTLCDKDSFSDRVPFAELWRALAAGVREYLAAR